MIAYEEFERGPEFVSPGLATMGAVFER